MRLLIVSDDVPDVAGVVIGRAGTSQAKAIGEKLAEELTKDSRGLVRQLIDRVRSAADRGSDSSSDDSELARLKRALPEAMQRAYQQGLDASVIADASNITAFGLELVAPSKVPITRLPFEERCITVLPGTAPPIVERPVYSAQVFQGAFTREGQLDALLQCHGGSSRIHIVQRNVAKELFRRHGGGILEQVSLATPIRVNRDRSSTGKFA